MRNMEEVTGDILPDGRAFFRCQDGASSRTRRPAYRTRAAPSTHRRSQRSTMFSVPGNNEPIVSMVRTGLHGLA